MSKKLVIGSDHFGLGLKNQIRDYLVEKGYEVDDVGTDSLEPVDYPDIAEKLAIEISEGKFERGILVCGTGAGMAIVANKVPNVFAALCTSGVQAEYARRHNNANVLVLGARITGRLEAEDILNRFLKFEFEGGRHARRVDKIKNGF